MSHKTVPIEIERLTKQLDKSKHELKVAKGEIGRAREECNVMCRALARSKEKVRTLKTREAILLNNNRMLLEMVKGYSEREALVIANTYMLAKVFAEKEKDTAKDGVADKNIITLS